MSKKFTIEDIEPEMHKRIFGVINRTWNTIAADAPTRMPRSHVIEMVLDADYLEMYGKDDEAVDVLRRLSDEEQDKLADKAV